MGGESGWVGDLGLGWELGRGGVGWDGVVWVAEYSRTAWMKEKKGYTLVDVQCTIVQKYMLYRSPHEVKGELRVNGGKISCYSIFLFLYIRYFLLIHDFMSFVSFLKKSRIQPNFFASPPPTFFASLSCQWSLT
jgi:hypothetical protein